MTDLIWAGAVFIPAMFLAAGLLVPARRALDALRDSFVKSAVQRDAAATKLLAEGDERRHAAAVRRGAAGEEVAREKARLAAETARFETDAEAARQCLPAAVEGRRKALGARAEAEAAIAPEAARKALEASGGEVMAALGKAYAVYCQERPSGTSLMGFGEWAGPYAGPRR